MRDKNNQHHTLEDKIQNNDKGFVLLSSALGDRISFEIIKSTMKSAKSAIEISIDNRIPISSVYKKIQKLEELGILQVQKVVKNNKNGKRISYYRCAIKSLELAIDDAGPRMLFETNTN